jgi:hypothetical protein
MNAENESKVKPPYVSYKTFFNFIGSLRQSGVPSRIDRSVPALAGQSGAAQSFLLGALRFLGLISQDGTPSATLKEVVAHPANEKTTLAKAVRESYAFVFNSGFNIDAATEAQLAEKFRERDLSGQTVRKATSFFVAICESVGIALSPHLRPKRGQGNGVTRRYRKRRSGEEDQVPPSPVHQGASTVQNQLIDKFPKFDPGWSPEIQSKWFEAFGKLYNTIDKGESGK